MSLNTEKVCVKLYSSLTRMEESQPSASSAQGFSDDSIPPINLQQQSNSSQRRQIVEEEERELPQIQVIEEEDDDDLNVSLIQTI